MSDKLLALSRYLSHFVNEDVYMDEYAIRDMLKPYKQEYIQTVVVSAQTDATTQTDCSVVGGWLTTDGSR